MCACVWELGGKGLEKEEVDRISLKWYSMPYHFLLKEDLPAHSLPFPTPSSSICLSLSIPGKGSRQRSTSLRDLGVGVWGTGKVQWTCCPGWHSRGGKRGGRRERTEQRAVPHCRDPGAWPLVRAPSDTGRCPLAG